jgi:hypothetical protein
VASCSSLRKRRREQFVCGVERTGKKQLLLLLLLLLLLMKLLLLLNQKPMPMS